MLNFVKKYLGRWAAGHFSFYRQAASAFAAVQEINGRVQTMAQSMTQSITQTIVEKHAEIAGQIVEMNNKLLEAVADPDPMVFHFQRLRKLAPEVEFYQPLYKLENDHFFHDRQPQRPCLDRAEAIFKSCEENVTGIRILDVGASLGFFSFYFSDRGARVTGLENNEKNLLVSESVKGLNKLQPDFLLRALDLDFVERLPANKFEAALLLSVLHHVVFYQGLDYARQLMKNILEKIPVLFVELALKTEEIDVFWKTALPEDPLSLFELCPNIRIELLGNFPTHLSQIKRPLYKISRLGTVQVNQHHYSVEKMTTHAYRHTIIGASRNFYFSEDAFVKEYVFLKPGDLFDNRKQIVREIANFINLADAGLNTDRLPRMLDFEIRTTRALLVLEKIQGVLLSECMQTLTDRGKLAVFAEVLIGLQELRLAGLHHNDVRCWNVIVENHTAYLIDLGMATGIEVENLRDTLLWLLGELAVGKILSQEYPRKGVPFSRAEEYGAVLGPVAGFLLAQSSALDLDNFCEVVHQRLGTLSNRPVLSDEPTGM